MVSLFMSYLCQNMKLLANKSGKLRLFWFFLLFIYKKRKKFHLPSSGNQNTQTHTDTHRHTHTHTHTHTYIVSRRCWFLFRYRFSQMSNLNLEDSDSYSEISFLKLQIKLETPKSIFWANLSRKNWILPFAWKLVHRVSCGCECKVTDQGLEAKLKMNNCDKCLLLLYFHRS